MSNITRPRNHSPSTLPRIEGDRAVVEQAKGAVMLSYGIGAHEAFALLLTWSRDMDTTLRTIAHTLVNGACQVGDDDHYDPALVGWLRDQLSEDLSDPTRW